MADDDHDDCALREFDLGDGCMLRVKEFTLLQDEAGAVVWDAGLVLAYFLAHQHACGRPLLRGRTVLELGSGTGAVGLAAARLGAAAVWLSDLPHLLPYLRENIQLNGLGARCSALPLEWANAAHLAAARNGELRRPPDLLLAADTVYTHAGRRALFATLAELMRPAPPAVAAAAVQEQPAATAQERAPPAATARDEAQAAATAVQPKGTQQGDVTDVQSRPPPDLDGFGGESWPSLLPHGVRGDGGCVRCAEGGSGAGEGGDGGGGSASRGGGDGGSHGGGGGGDDDCDGGKIRGQEANGDDDEASGSGDGGGSGGVAYLSFEERPGVEELPALCAEFGLEAEEVLATELHPSWRSDDIHILRLWSRGSAKQQNQARP